MSFLWGVALLSSDPCELKLMHVNLSVRSPDFAVCPSDWQMVMDCETKRPERQQYDLALLFCPLCAYFRKFHFRCCVSPEETMPMPEASEILFKKDQQQNSSRNCRSRQEHFFCFQKKKWDYPRQWHRGQGHAREAAQQAGFQINQDPKLPS